MADKLKVGISGYGIVGKRRHQFIDLHPQMKTVAVCDRTFAGEGTFDDGVSYYTHYRKLLGEKLDILFVCMTNDIAPEVTIAGLEEGLHVFCEKPPGRDLADIARVIHCERRYPDLRLQYGFNHRRSKPHSVARRHRENIFFCFFRYHGETCLYKGVDDIFVLQWNRTLFEVLAI